MVTQVCWHGASLLTLLHYVTIASHSVLLFKIRNENNLTHSASAELQFLGGELFYEVSYETLKLTGFFLKKRENIV